MHTIVGFFKTSLLMKNVWANAKIEYITDYLICFRYKANKTDLLAY